MTARIPRDILDLLPAYFVERHRVVPLALNAGTLLVAHPPEMSQRTLDELGQLLGRRICGEPAEADDLTALIQLNYGLGAPAIESLVRANHSDASRAAPDVALHAVTQDLEGLTHDASLASFVNDLIRAAHSDSATDIHLEPFEHTLRTRIRIDGLLHELQIPPAARQFYPAIVSRLKVMAGLDIAEHRLPQDGRIRAHLGAEELDLRLSILPTLYGETIDIRILSNSTILRGLHSLGLEQDDATHVQEMLSKPHGVVLVTGPTGSGKTTTLYSFLSVLNNTQRKILTLEDPIEYKLDGITQMQVHPKIGLDFARGLRSMLRHDPDIMMVGEIRDQETAETVIRVSLTGHLVFSTVHTNDAPSTPARLMDMGIEPYLIASSVECILAQRLVRIVCPHCAIHISAPTEAAALGLSNDAYRSLQARSEVGFVRATGCSECRFIGYRGRTAIFEILPITRVIREHIVQRQTSMYIAAAATREGFSTLRWKGLLLAARGLTTIEEVLRVTTADTSE